MDRDRQTKRHDSTNLVRKICCCCLSITFKKNVFTKTVPPASLSSPSPPVCLSVSSPPPLLACRDYMQVYILKLFYFSWLSTPPRIDVALPVWLFRLLMGPDCLYSTHISLKGPHEETHTSHLKLPLVSGSIDKENVAQRLDGRKTSLPHQRLMAAKVCHCVLSPWKKPEYFLLSSKDIYQLL